MERKTILLISGGVVFTALFLIFSYMVRDQQEIWLLTRLFGILAFLVLFMALTLGELRILTKIKANFILFKYHTPLAIFSVYLVMLHGLTAVFDNFKWGKGLHFADYLGFSFSDKWLVFISLGTLAFYLMLIVSLTSATKVIQFTGYKRWKLIHYMSYGAFIIAYVHSMNLGTDLKSSFLSPFLSPFFLLLFVIVTSLMISRVLIHYFNFEQLEIVFFTMLIFVIILGFFVLANIVVTTNEQITSLKDKIGSDNMDISIYQTQVQALTDKNIRLQMAVKNG